MKANKGFTRLEFRTKAKELLYRYICDNSKVDSGRKFVLISMIVWLASRAAEIIVQVIASVKINNIKMSFINIGMLLAFVIFAYGIYKYGLRLISYIIGFGGLFMLMQAFSNNMFRMAVNFKLQPLLRAYCIVFIASAIIQIAIVLLVLIHPLSRLYMSSVRQSYYEAENILNEYKQQKTEDNCDNTYDVNGRSEQASCKIKQQATVE